MTVINSNRAVRGPVTGVPVVAGKGVRLVADTQNNRWVVEADETVLWEGSLSTTTGTATLSEATGNFERIKVYIQATGVSDQSTIVHELSLVYRPDNGYDALAYVAGYEKHSNVTTQNMIYLHFTGTYGTGLRLEAGSKWVGSTFTERVSSYNFTVVKVVGVNRIASN